MSLTCAQFRELAPGFALGALDPDEVAACRAHLTSAESHQGCAETLAEAEMTAGSLSAALMPVKPRAEVWTLIEARVAARPSADDHSSADEKETSSPRRRDRVAYFPWAVAAVAAVLAVFFFRDRLVLREAMEKQATQGRATEAALRAHQEMLAESQREMAKMREEYQVPQEATSLMMMPATRVVQMPAQGGGTHHAVALLNTDMKKAVVMARGIKANPGKDYELWFIRDGKPVAAGLLKPDANGNAMLNVGEEIVEGGAQVLAVTVEREGGVPSPEGTPVLVGQVI